MKVGRITVMAAAVAAVFATAAASGGADPGSAKRAESGCPAATLCVWSKRHFEGQRVKLTKVGEVTDKLYRVMNDDASSFKNKTDEIGYLYSDVGGAGPSISFCPGDKVRSLKKEYDFDNRASSSSLGLPALCP
jgi:hypothetical protein